MTHKNVQEALVAILDELPAIGKNQRAPAVMGGYGFRGIDDVLNALNPLLGKHGVFFAPEVRERIDGQFTNAKGNVTWTVKLHVQYTFWCASSGTCLTTSVWGEAHDSGDKATQKALTAAQKSMLFQVFAINTADQADSDSERHEAIPAVSQPYGGDAEIGPDEEAVPERPYMSGMNVKRFIDQCAEAGATLHEVDGIVGTATDGRTSEPNRVYADEVTVLRAAFESWQAEHQKVAPSAKPNWQPVPTTRAGESPEALTGKPPGKSVPKRPLAQTEGVVDVKNDGTLV